MCVVSMVMDDQLDRWTRHYPVPINPAPFVFSPIVIGPSQREVDEFRRLLDRAREYDKRNHEPDCEMDAKKQKLLDYAKELGVDISFIND